MLRDIERLVPQTVVIGSPAGREHVIADLMSVKLSLIDSMRCYVKSSLQYLVSELKNASQKTRALRAREIFAPRRTYQSRLPVV
jgi:hypothetical protein